MSKFFLAYSIIGSIICCIYKPYKANNISLRLRIVISISNIILFWLASLIIFSQYIQEILQYKNLLNDIFLLYGQYYLTVIIYQQIDIDCKIKCLKSGQITSNKNLHTFMINMGIFSLISGFIILREDNKRSYYIQYRQLYLSLFLIIIEITKIHQLIRILIENPVIRIRKLYEINDSQMSQFTQSLTFYKQYNQEDCQQLISQQNNPLQVKKDFSYYWKKLKKYWILVSSLLEIIFVFMMLMNLLYEVFQVFFSANIVDKVSFIVQMFESYMQYEEIIQQDQSLLEIYKILLKLSFFVYTLTETASKTQIPSKNILKPYRQEIVLKNYIRLISVFVLTVIFTTALYPSIILTNDASDCYLRYDSNCNLSFLGEITLEIMQIREVFVLQYLMLLYTVGYSWYRLYKIITEKPQYQQLNTI